MRVLLDKKEFAKRLEQAMIEQGLNAKKLSEMANLSYNSISAWRNCTKTPSISSLFALTKALNVSVDYWYHKEQRKAPEGNYLGMKIKELLKRSKITQTELADALNVSQATISRWINGVETTRERLEDYLQEIAFHLDVELAELKSPEPDVKPNELKEASEIDGFGDDLFHHDEMFKADRIIAQKDKEILELKAVILKYQEKIIELYEKKLQ